jgi:peroxiredoxin
MRRKLATIGVTSVLFAIAGAGAIQAYAVPGNQRQAADFTLNDWQGKKVSMDTFHGKIVLLEFFQTGCPPCRVEAPLLEHLYSEYQEKGVVVVGISHDQGGAEALKKFAGEFGVTYPLLIGDLEVAVRYIGITPQNPGFDIPHYFVIDRQGAIVHEVLPGGEKTPQETVTELEQDIKDLLARSPASSPAKGMLSK